MNNHFHVNYIDIFRGRLCILMSWHYRNLALCVEHYKRLESQIKNECSEKEYNHILFGEKVDMKFMSLKWNITTVTCIW